MSSIHDEGLEDLEQELEEYARNADEGNILKVLQEGADAFTRDLLALPRPMSRITKAGHTHLVRSFANKTDDVTSKGPGIVVGWGVYYGPIVEKKFYAHLKPTWKSNEKKYYELMQKKILEV